MHPHVLPDRRGRARPRLPGLVAVVDRDPARRDARSRSTPTTSSSRSPKPHAPTVCNSMWALTDFTEANGATRIIPGSHLADHSPDYGSRYDSIPAEMPKGSVLVWHGSLWHGGGANTHRRAPRRHRDELLRRLHPPAGEPAARHPARDRRPVRAAAARARRLRRLQQAHRPHRQALARSSSSSTTRPSAASMVWDEI